MLPRAAASRHAGHVPFCSRLALVASYFVRQDFTGPLSHAALSNGFCLNSISACLISHLPTQTPNVEMALVTESSHLPVSASGGTNPESPPPNGALPAQ